MSAPASLSFKFSKTTRKQLNGTQNSNDPSKKDVIRQEEEEESEIQISEPVLISGFDHKGFKAVGGDANGKEEKKELVIPALQNTIRLPILIAAADDEEAAAKRALLDEAQRLIDQVKEKIEDTSTIPVKANAEEKVDFSTVSTEEADYESVSVDVFGKALLRGMGWKEGDAIGRSGKKSMAPIVTAPRPKGLGLGAQIKPPPGTTASSSGQPRNGEAEEALVLKIGAYVKRTDAKSDKDRYGKVISWDEDNACIVVQMAIGRSTVRISQHKVHVVTHKEFEKAGKCINQSAYQEYKEVEEKKFGKRLDEIPEAEDLFKLEKKEDDRKKRRDGPDSQKEHGKDGRSSSHKDRRKDDSKSRKRDRSRSPAKSSKSWLRPDIRVRIVDDKYRRGKFFKSKAVVVDVKSAGVCSCMAEDGKTLLDDLNEDMLETVVPRNNGAAVLILRGSNAGKIGTLLERDTRSCVAVVQLSDTVKNVSFDDICEYVGDVPDD